MTISEHHGSSPLGDYHYTAIDRFTPRENGRIRLYAVFTDKQPGIVAHAQEIHELRVKAVVTQRQWPDSDVRILILDSNKFGDNDRNAPFDGNQPGMVRKVYGIPGDYDFPPWEEVADSYLAMDIKVRPIVQTFTPQMEQARILRRKERKQIRKRKWRRG